jgi:hypothetical protein
VQEAILAARPGFVLAGVRACLYLDRVIGCLRLIGILNAAIWFGTAIFVMFGASPAFSSHEMRALLPPANYPYFSGAIDQILLTRFFRWQLACGLIALVHLVVEGLYLGRGFRRFRLGLLLGLFWLNLVCGLWIQPKLDRYHLIETGMGATPERRQAAHGSFRAWNALAVTLNLFTLAGLGIYLWRVANPPDATRFASAVKFRS